MCVAVNWKGKVCESFYAIEIFSRALQRIVNQITCRGHMWTEIQILGAPLPQFAPRLSLWSVSEWPTMSLFKVQVHWQKVAEVSSMCQEVLFFPCLLWCLHDSDSGWDLNKHWVACCDWWFWPRCADKLVDVHTVQSHLPGATPVFCLVSFVPVQFIYW